MGREVLAALAETTDLQIVAAVDAAHAGKSIRELIGESAPDLTVQERLGQALDQVQAHVLVDFTTHSAAPQNAMTALQRKVAPVIGTTGLSTQDVRALVATAREQKTPGLYAPNFAIGAVLMIRFAEIAAQFLPDAEIIELHHDKKEDAPSGTALLTAERIAFARKDPPTKLPKPFFKVEGVRGGKHRDVTIHSVRLPGLLAHQQIIFGGLGETLTLRHDSLSRVSFMPGVKLAVRQVLDLDEFVVGLDQLLFR